MNNIHLEPLGNGVKIYVSESYHFSTDTILLADFSKPKAYKKCADLGTGCGTIPLLWLKGDKSLKIDAVELQQNACKLAEKSVELNGFADNMRIINADLREFQSFCSSAEGSAFASAPKGLRTLWKVCADLTLSPSGSGLFSRGQSKRRSFFCLRAGEAENAVISTLCPRCLSRTKAATFQMK